MAVGGRQGWGIIPDGGTCIGYMENSLEGPEVSKCGQRGERGWLGEGMQSQGRLGPRCGSQDCGSSTFSVPASAFSWPRWLPTSWEQPRPHSKGRG